MVDAELREFLQLHDKHRSVILIVSTIVSYIPQYRRLHRKRDGNGLSLWYLLLNAIAATEQLTLLANLFVTSGLPDFKIPGSLIRTPPSVTDWLNLVQFSITWACSSGLLLMHIWYRPSRPFGKAGAVLAYLAWIGASLAMVGFEAMPGFRAGPSEQRRWMAENFMKYHFGVLNPVSVVGTLASFFTQASTTLWLRRRHSLSVVTLILQAVVFAALAKSWSGRMHMRPDSDSGGGGGDDGLAAPPSPEDADSGGAGLEWYTGGGWAVIHSGVFAAVQLGLLCVSLLMMCMWPRSGDKKAMKQKQKQKEKQKKAKQKLKEERRTNKAGQRNVFGRRRRAKTGERMPLLARLSPTVGSRATSPRWRSEARSPDRTSIFGGMSPTREGRGFSRRASRAKSPDRRSIFSSLSPTRDEQV